MSMLISAPSVICIRCSYNRNHLKEEEHPVRKVYEEIDRMSDKIKTIMQDVVKNIGIPAQNIVSGAGHDAMVMHRVSEHVAMIFVRSKGGHSHRPYEWTSYEDLQAGSEVILETITRLAEE